MGMVREALSLSDALRAMRQRTHGTAEIANASRIAAKNASMLFVFTEN